MMMIIMILQRNAALLLSVFLISPFFLMAQDGPALLTRMLTVLEPENSQARMTQVINTTSGAKREFHYDYYTANKGEKVLIRYTYPARSRGMATLMLNNARDIWTYFPRTKRVRKLASSAKHQNFEGSDFTYEDMGAGNAWQKDYTTTRLADQSLESQDCYTLQLTPKPETDAAYSKLVILVRKRDFSPLEIHYHDTDGRHIKTLFFQDIRDVEGIPTAFKMVMKNKLGNSSTEMGIESITYDVTYPAGFFTERELRK